MGLHPQLEAFSYDLILFFAYNRHLTAFRKNGHHPQQIDSKRRMYLFNAAVMPIKAIFSRRHIARLHLNRFAIYSQVHATKPFDNLL